MLLRHLTATLLCTGLAAQTADLAGPLTDLLPTSTYAVVEFGGLAACRAEANALPLAALVHGFLDRVPADVRSERLERGIDTAADRLQRLLQRLDLDAHDLQAILRQPMLLAIGRLTIEGMGPSLCLVVDERGATAAIDRVRAALRQHLPGARLEAAEVAGVALEQLTMPGGPPVWFGSLAGRLVVSNSRGYLEEIAAVAGGAAPSLGAGLRAMPGAAPGGPPLASLFLDGRRVLASLEPHLPYEAARWSDTLGIGLLQTLHVSVRGGADRLQVGIGGSSHGLAKVLLAAPADLGFARACSANTVAFGAGTLDLAGLMAAWQGLLTLLPAEPSRELQRELGRGLRRAGAKPGEVAAIARAFAPQVAFALALEKGAVPKPELLLRVGVRDAAVVRDALQGLETETTREGLEWRARRVGEHTIRFCNVRLPGDGLQLSPCYVLHADGLWCASDTAALVRALRQAEHGDDSLAAQPDFVALQRATQGASGVLHLRWFRAAELGWRSVETWLYPQLDAHSDELGFGREALPDADETARALATGTLVYRIDDAGVTVDSRGPFTIGSLLAAVGALADDVLSRAAGRIY